MSVRHDLATIVFFVRAAGDAEAISEANRIVDRFAGTVGAQAELRRAADAADWRHASKFRGPAFAARSKAPEPISAIAG